MGSASQLSGESPGSDADGEYGARSGNRCLRCSPQAAVGLAHTAMTLRTLSMHENLATPPRAP